jgi:hypothetical protein
VKARGSSRVLLSGGRAIEASEMLSLDVTLAGDLISLEPRVPLLLWDLLK